MKKLICLFSAFALVFTSCSSDDTPVITTPVDTSGILVTRIIETYDDNSTYTTEYVYSGNKIVSASGSDGYEMFTYTGNLITKIEFFLSDNTLDQVETYSYDSSDRLISLVRVYPTETSWGDKQTYTYNTNGTISVSFYSGNYTSQTNLDRTGEITFLNGEISQITTSDGNTDNYTYDNKINPFKNVLGFNKFYFIDALTDGNLNNVTEMTSSTIGGSYVNSYTYNANNFPLTCESVSSQETILEEYFYN
jgi:hypothetical protein